MDMEKIQEIFRSIREALFKIKQRIQEVLRRLKNVFKRLPKEKNVRGRTPKQHRKMCENYSYNCPDSRSYYHYIPCSRRRLPYQRRNF